MFDGLGYRWLNQVSAEVATALLVGAVLQTAIRAPVVLGAVTYPRQRSAQPRLRVLRRHVADVGFGGALAAYGFAGVSLRRARDGAAAETVPLCRGEESVCRRSLRIRSSIARTHQIRIRIVQVPSSFIARSMSSRGTERAQLA